MKAEYRKGCLQRDSVEREGYAGARSAGNREGMERDGASDLMERILNRENLNRAYAGSRRICSLKTTAGSWKAPTVR